MKHRVQITPNTGHHSFWLPFDIDDLSGSWPEMLDLLVKSPTRFSAWLPTPNDDDNGEIYLKSPTSNLFPHLRFKYANSPANPNAPGILLVVESNLGDNARGNVFSEEAVAEVPYRGQPRSRYAYATDTEIPESRLESYEVVYPQYPDTPLLSFEIQWATSMASAPIPVDLIIDFGNSRTTAVLLEQVPGASDGSSTTALRRMVQPLRFFSRDASLNGQETVLPVGTDIIDSWFVLSQPRFADYEIPFVDDSHLLTELGYEVRPAKKNFFGRVVTPEARVTTTETRRIAQTFVELAPLVFGPGSDNALNAINPQGGGLQMLSSPKRYAWANDGSVQEGTPFWAMLRNAWDSEADSTQNAKLACQVLRFFPHNGTDWSLNDAPTGWEPIRRPSCKPDSPNYPKADSLSWMGLGVLEAAYRWINCREYSKENLPYVKRFIRSVKLTYPSGWTEEELNAYRNKWKKAANIFHLGHQHGAAPIEVAFPLDEAIASQLPFIFSEIEAMHGMGENYLELVGKKRGRDDAVSLRALNIDIGGGTTDFAIVEYSDKLDGAGVELEAKVLFKDSTNIAGDEVVKALIEQIVLPEYGQNLVAAGEQYRETYASLLREPFKNEANREEWKRATLRFFVPHAVRCIKFLNTTASRLDLSVPEEGRKVAIKGLADKASSFFAEHGLGDVKIDQYFEISTGKNKGLGTKITKPEISNVIREVLTPVIRRLAKFVAAFDVDLVILSGKPSEAPIVREMVAELLPITEDRLIAAKNYSSGDWYPFAKNGRISDAKTVTVVGLALFEAITRGYVPGWSMKQTIPGEARRNYWLLLPVNVAQEVRVFLEPDQDEATVEMLVNSRIARKLLPSTDAPEPTYVLRWKSTSTPQPSRIKAVVRRVIRTSAEGSERLELISATDANTGQAIARDKLKLEICTIQQEDYWLDSPRFEVQWPQE